MWDLNVWQVIAALLLDLLLGDPRWMPHASRFAGMLGKVLERPCIAISGRTEAPGWLFVALIVTGMVAAFGVALWVLPDKLSGLLEIVVFYQAFAAMETQRRVRAILRPLGEGKLTAAREALAKIVARDTAELDETAISRGAVEFVGERACRALIAPLFWGALLGPAGALIYSVAEALNREAPGSATRSGNFRQPARKLANVLNWLPARILAVLSETFREFRSIRRIALESRRQRDSNSGLCQSAIAHALETRLGGTNFYGGEPLVEPVFNESAAMPEPATVKLSLVWMWKIAAFGFLLLILASFNG